MRSRNALLNGLFCVAALFPGVGAAQYAIEPMSPKPLESVRLLVPLDLGFFGPSPLSMTGNRITVVRTFPNILPSPPMGDRFLELGRYPPGEYEVIVLSAIGDRPPQDVIATLSFTVTNTPRVVAYPLANFTDLWWDPAESGWGLGITQHVSDALFATWFVYGPDGRATWYVIPGGAWTARNLHEGAVYKTTGPYFGGPFDPSRVTVTLVGTATIHFTEYDRATFTYTIDGVTGTKTIRRQPF